MTDLGFICLSLALATTTYSVFAFALGGRQRYEQLTASGRKSLHAATGLLSLAVFSLTYALVARDFTVEYVASHTSRDLSLPYTIAGLFAGQQGSLLFWTWLLALFASAFLLRYRRRRDAFLPYTALIMASVQVFFLLVLVFFSNPFMKLDFVPPDGLGMNPLLQNPSMLWHPPILYLGYVGFTVPFALALGALISGRLDSRYLVALRGWTLFPWLCLGLGTLLGAQWAYVELGWGGYWAWDPVENASLMPWLTSTALVHSLMIQERRRTMKPWNVALVVLSFTLCIFGTFITRSGVLSSVHGFGASRIGLPFLAFLGLILIGSAVLLFRRLPELKAEREWGSTISRQSALLLSALLLLAATGAILLGTVFPVISGAVQVALTTDYFNWTSALILGPLVLLMGICPFTYWRGSTPRELIRDLVIPLVAGLVVIVSLLILGPRDLFAILAFSVCAFVIVAILLQFSRGLRSGRRTSGRNYLSVFASMMRRQRRRYGAYVVHLGIALVTIGVIGSSAYRIDEEAVLGPGDTVTIGSYSLRYDDFSYYPAEGKDVASVTLSVFQDGRAVGVLVPEKHFHRTAQQPVSEVSIRTTLREDLYVTLIGWEGDGPAIGLEVVISPLVVWMWIGGGVLLVGAAMAMWPVTRREDLQERIEDEILGLRQAGVQTSPKETTR
jgi:cytochrome c-type biogenesis protein CcmF